jgi:hypothetical protein
VTSATDSSAKAAGGRDTKRGSADAHSGESGFSQSLLIAEFVKRLSYRGIAIYRPQLYHFWRQASLISCSPTALLEFFCPNYSARSSEVTDEFRALSAEVASRPSYTQRKYPEIYSTLPEEQLLLFGLIRLGGLRRVFESGVADGLSTLFEIHGSQPELGGRVISFDLAGDVGLLSCLEIVRGEGASNWLLAKLT